MTVKFNNCRNRQHTRIYGRDDAFFDLYTTGRHAPLARGLVKGTKCVVVSKFGATSVEIRVYEFMRESAMPNEQGTIVRVFHGSELLNQRVVLSKKEAAASDEYSIFFNSLGHFKQVSGFR